MSVFIISNSITNSVLTKLRDKNSTSAEFRENAKLLSFIMAYEAGKELKTEDKPTASVLADINSPVLSEQITLAPILRAGLGMTDSFLKIYKEASIAPLGLSRDHETLKPTLYYSNIPKKVSESLCFILDPMLATGGTACFAVDYLTSLGVKCERMKLFSILASPEGIDKVKSSHPKVDIYLIAKDEKLNGRGYILPGLGDAGDRIFNT